MNAVETLYADGFVRMNSEPLRRYLRKSVGAEHAEDLMQEVFLRFLQRFQSSTMTEGHAVRWLYTVARHLASDFHRGAGRQCRFPIYDPDGDSFPDARESKSEEARDMQEVHDRMFVIAEEMGRAGLYRRLLGYLLDDRIHQSDISRKLGVSTRTVRRMTEALFRELSVGLKKSGHALDFFG